MDVWTPGLFRVSKSWKLKKKMKNWTSLFRKFLFSQNMQNPSRVQNKLAVVGLIKNVFHSKEVLYGENSLFHRHHCQNNFEKKRSDDEGCQRWKFKYGRVNNNQLNGHMKCCYPGSIFFFDPVVLESICCRTRVNRLINESNATRWLRKEIDESSGLDSVSYTHLTLPTTPYV